MELLKNARAELVAALKPLIDIGLRYTEYGPVESPPATAVGPPSVNWTTYDGAPTDIDFQVFIIVAFSDRSVETLLDFLEPVVEALESISGVTVSSAIPTTYAPADLPCYMLTANVPLS